MTHSVYTHMPYNRDYYIKNRERILAKYYKRKAKPEADEKEHVCLTSKKNNNFNITSGKIIVSFD